MAASIALAACPLLAAEEPAAFEKNIRPMLEEFCLDCHSTEKQKGDLDLERFTSFDEVKRHAKVWQDVEEQLALGEMPPKKKPQPSDADKARLLGWVRGVLGQLALEHAGDPGPVVLRRLSNAEYTATIRDITGVASLDPAREFPVDGAAGEGFSNVGGALVMSPSTLTKYLDAAKQIAAHAVLLPDGIRFSEKVSRRDLTDEMLGNIRDFYARYSDAGGAQKVNLQGIVFDTNGGGRLPVEEYLAATLVERDALACGTKTLESVARHHRLNAKYLGLLWTMLNGTEPSLLFDELRAAWRAAGPDDAAKMAASIAARQKTLWRFSSVGQIGKTGGPKAWMEPVTPIADRQEVRLKMPAASEDAEVVISLQAGPAGDGSEHDAVVWESPRLVAPGRPDLLLRDFRPLARGFEQRRARLFAGAAKCLAAAAEADGADVAGLAKRHGIETDALAAWLDYLGVGPGDAARIDSLLTQRKENSGEFEFIKGWEGGDALSVNANSSGREVRVPGVMKPHGIAVHPSPARAVAVGWRSPVAAAMKIEARIRHAHPECGNGVAWSLELRRGHTRQRLAGGVAQGGNEGKTGPLEKVAVQPGDLVSIIVGPRDGNHSCDLTAIDLTLSGGGNAWDLAREISPNILAGNPHADAEGRAGVWNFYSEPATGGDGSVIPQGSVLAQWQSAGSPEEKRRLAEKVQQLLQGGAAVLAKDSPDAALYRQLASLRGPLFSRAGDVTAVSGGESKWGLALERFGKMPDGAAIAPASLGAHAPGTIEFRLSADMVEGCEFVATGTLREEGSVQLRAVLGAAAPLTALASDAPIVTREGSPARARIESAFAAYRDLFPAALCYTKIVPVDEVITLRLFHREDDALCRLMLDDAEKARLDRMWSELRFISQDALLLVDVFNQLWQYATQDSTPELFEPLRQPILDGAAAFKKQTIAAEPRQLESVLDFAALAWRRPLAETDREELRGLHRRLRAEDLAHEDALRLTLARVLLAPAFLYKMEEAAPGDKQAPVSDWELASRLSYFLWSSAPDAGLRAAAAAGQLHEPETLLAQTRRMLADPRVRRLATEFGTHWLHTYGFDSFDEKSAQSFPTFAGVRAALNEEPIRFFTDFFQRDGSLLSLLDADHTFVNETLAKHYGIDGVSGGEWRRIDGLRARGRGGILGFGAALAKQSGASRTSPILRGNWLSEVLLGERLPRPPKGVPVLPDDPSSTAELTERQLTERHVSDPACARCHDRIDPFGYALEHFDAIGRFRETDAAGRRIDSRSKLADGTELDGLDGLRGYLLHPRRHAFVRQFCRKLLGYALGRAVQLSDRPLLERIEARLAANDWRIGVAIEEIVASRQFRDIRGRSAAPDA